MECETQLALPAGGPKSELWLTRLTREKAGHTKMENLKIILKMYYKSN